MSEVAEKPMAAPRPYLAHPGLAAFAATLLAFVAVAKIGFSARGLLDAALCAVFTVLAVIDFERRIIPNVIVLPATAITLVAQVAISPSDWAWYVGASAGAGVSFLVLA